MRLWMIYFEGGKDNDILFMSWIQMKLLVIIIYCRTCLKSFGSYQPRLSRGHLSLIQQLTAFCDEDICTLDQYHEYRRLSSNVEEFITDIEEEPIN